MSIAIFNTRNSYRLTLCLLPLQTLTLRLRYAGSGVIDRTYFSDRLAEGSAQSHLET